MGWKRPPWVRDELRRRGVRSSEAKRSHFPLGEEIQPAVEEQSVADIACNNHHDEIRFVDLLKACCLHKNLQKGREIHDQLNENGLLQKNIYIANSLVHMYAKCGALAQAKSVLEELPTRTVVSWTALIAGYAQHGQGEEALLLFDQMKEEGLFPDGIALASVLKACGIVRAFHKGEQVYAIIIREGLLERFSLLGGALVDMYAKFGSLGKAQKVFDDLPHQSLVSWTVLIGGYCEQGHYEKALQCFAQMNHEGFSPDPMVFASILKACASLGAADVGKEIHSEIARRGFLKNDNILKNALVDMYAKSGEVTKAKHLFEELSCHDVVSWNILITGYCQEGLSEKALDCFDKMKEAAVSPDVITFACALKACSSIGALEKGKEIHTEIVREGLFKKAKLGSALVDMYAKCGALLKAQEVFYTLAVRDLVSWTALIAGFSEHGRGGEALTFFEQMQSEGLYPDAVTLSCVLKACASIGAAEKGQSYFEALSSRYGIVPTLEHCTCIVSLLGRTGHTETAVSLLQKMYSSDSQKALFAFMHSSRNWSIHAGSLPIQNVAF